MKYVRSAIAGVVTVLVTFLVVDILTTGKLAIPSLMQLAVLVVMVRAIWWIVAGVFLLGFVLWLWREDRAETLARVSADRSP